MFNSGFYLKYLADLYQILGNKDQLSQKIPKQFFEPLEKIFYDFFSGIVYSSAPQPMSLKCKLIASGFTVALLFWRWDGGRGGGGCVSGFYYGQELYEVICCFERKKIS
jgi:hypothetical protein